MNILVQADFINSFSIPDTGDAIVQTKLTDYITRFEKQYLITLLGYAMYKDLQAGLGEDPVPTKWTNLVDGYEYTNTYGDLCYFDGLKLMLKNFVHAEFNKGELISKLSTAGEVAPELINMRKETERSYYSKFNEGVKISRYAHDYIYANITDFTNFVYTEIKFSNPFGF